MDEAEQDDTHISWKPVGVFVRHIVHEIGVARLRKLGKELATAGPAVAGALGEKDALRGCNGEEKPRTNPGELAVILGEERGTVGHD